VDRALAEVIARFVPGRVARHPLLAAPLESPHTERADGAVLFADISGFTALSEDLARSGAQAGEELTAILNDYFGRLTSIIDSHGGDLVKFADDALLALWPGSSDEAQLAATWRAAHCAREIQQLLRAYGVPLSIDVAAPSISRPSCRAQSGSASRRARPTGSVSCAG
jgi:class 3 adenylate cyclase